MIMSLIQNNVLVIVLVLLALNIIEGLIIYVQHKAKQKNKGRKKSVLSGYVPKEKYSKACIERDDFRKKVGEIKKDYEKIKKEYTDLKNRFDRNKDDYGDVIIKNQQLKQALEDLKNDKLLLEKRISELTLENIEQKNKSDGNEPVLNVHEIVAEEVSTTVIPKTKEELVDNAASNSSQTPIQDVVSNEVAEKENVPKEEPNNNPIKEEPKVESATEEQKNEPSQEELINETTKVEPNVEPSKEKTMYASFPRSAGSSIYFSDLSENLVEDSYFELKVSLASGKATFKPLDFMKIRNYDPAMAAMRTEGVKPNVASTVQGIEHGKAHKEGKDWFIDNPAKIKLA